MLSTNEKTKKGEIQVNADQLIFVKRSEHLETEKTKKPLDGLELLTNDALFEEFLNKYKKTLMETMKKKKHIKNTLGMETFTIVNNGGGGPFQVTLFYKYGIAAVFHQNTSKIRTIKYTRAFIGEDIGMSEHGCAFLFETGNNEYIFVGDRILCFKTDKKIVKFYSEIGNSRVVYPFAITEDGYYIMFATCRNAVDIVKFDSKLDLSCVNGHHKDDPYGNYYGHCKEKKVISKKALKVVWETRNNCIGKPATCWSDFCYKDSKKVWKCKKCNKQKMFLSEDGLFKHACVNHIPITIK